MTDIAYVATHGFAARMLMQTDLLGKLVDSGHSIALIVPDAKDPVTSAYCERRGVALWQYAPTPSRLRGEMTRLRRYLLDDLFNNPPLYERHRLLAEQKGSPWAAVRPWFYLKLHQLSRKSSLPGKWFKQLEDRFLRRREALDLLEAISPRLLVATYPVNVTEGQLQLAAQMQGRRSAIHLLSWDNIPSKGYFYQLADDYLLWGEVMRKELRKYYGVAKERINVVGVPHFDVHVQSRKQPEAGPYLSGLGLRADRPHLFFGMNSAYSSPGEMDVAEWLAAAVEKNVFGPGMQLVVRPHPQNLQGSWSQSSWRPRLESIKSNRVGVDFPDLVDSGLAWSMRADDMTRLSQLIAGSSLVFNSGSTIAIDALMCNVPVIHNGFDAALEDIAPHQSVKRLNHYRHLKKLMDAGGVVRVDSFAELEKEALAFLANPGRFVERRREVIRAYCANYDRGNATENAVNAVLRLLKEVKEPEIV